MISSSSGRTALATAIIAALSAAGCGHGSASPKSPPTTTVDGVTVDRIAPGPRGCSDLCAETVTFGGTTYFVSACPLKEEATHGRLLAAAAPLDVQALGADFVRALPVPDVGGHKFVAVHMRDVNHDTAEWR